MVVTNLKMKGVDGLEALREDVHDFFPKPIKIKELKESIRKALVQS